MWVGNQQCSILTGMTKDLLFATSPRVTPILVRFLVLGYGASQRPIHLISPARYRGISRIWPKDLVGNKYAFLTQDVSSVESVPLTLFYLLVEYVPIRILMELRSILWNRHGRSPIPCMQRYVLFNSSGSMVI